MCVGGGAGFSYNTKWGWHTTQHVHLWVSVARRENHSFGGTGTVQFIAVFCTRPPSSDEPRCPTTGGDRSRQALVAMEDYLAVRSDAVFRNDILWQWTGTFCPSVPPTQFEQLREDTLLPHCESC